MRIIAGACGGRRLHAPRGLETRPTSDRVKEAVFSILGTPPDGARVLDLFCGSGALALEALSRGADSAVLVDEAREATEAAERNACELGLDGRVTILRKEVGAALRGLSGPFDWIFLDPPYHGGALDRALRLLGKSGAVGPRSTVVAEHARKSPPADGYGPLVRTDVRTWGDTAVSIYRLSDPEQVPTP